MNTMKVTDVEDTEGFFLQEAWKLPFVYYKLTLTIVLQLISNQ